MMNGIALCFVLTALITGGVLSPKSDKDRDVIVSDKDVIVKEGHRVVVVEYEKEGDGNTKVLISPKSQVVEDYDVKEKGENIRAGPRELVCDAFGKCKHRIASALGKTKEVVTEKVTEVEEEAKEAIGKVKEEVGGKLKDSVEKVKEVHHDTPKKIREDVVGNVSSQISETKEHVKGAGEVVKEGAHKVSEGVGGMAEKAKDSAKEGAHRAGEIADKAKDMAKEGAHRVTERAGEMTEKTKDMAKEGAHRVTERAGEMTEKAKDMAKEGAHRVTERAGEMTEKAKDMAKESAHMITERAGEMTEKAKDMAKEGAHMITERAGEMTKKAKDMAEEGGEMTKEAKDAAKQGAHRVKDPAEEMTEKAKDSVIDGASRVGKEGKEKAAKAKEMVEVEGKKWTKDVLGDIVMFLVWPKGMDFVMRVVHLLGFSMVFGMSMWVTFVSSHVLAEALPRQQFGMLQSKVYPVYFRVQSYCIALALLGHLLSHRRRFLSSGVEMFHGFNLLASLLMSLGNLLYLEPKATKVMFERMKLEKEEGRGRVTLDPISGIADDAGDPVTATTERQGEVEDESKSGRLSEQLKKLNKDSSFLNVLTLTSLSLHLVYLGQRLHVDR